MLIGIVKPNEQRHITAEMANGKRRQMARCFGVQSLVREVTTRSSIDDVMQQALGLVTSASSAELGKKLKPFLGK